MLISVRESGVETNCRACPLHDKRITFISYWRYSSHVVSRSVK